MLNSYAKFEKKPGGEGWLVNPQKGLMIQMKPAQSTRHDHSWGCRRTAWGRDVASPFADKGCRVT